MTSFNLSSVCHARLCAGSFYQEFDGSRTFLLYSHDHPLSGWHVLPLEGDITCLRPEGALKSANCTTFTAAPKLGAFSVLPYSGVASKEACWFALTSYFRSKRDLLIVFLHRLTRERVDILY